MARFSRIEVVLKMRETGLIPVFYHSDTETCKKVIKASFGGGVRVFEFTNRGEFAHETFGELIKWAAKEIPEMILGIGSVMDPATASNYMQLGANFIVSPILNPEMAKVCNRRKVAWSPGCGSITEISKAEELGAEVVKVFPAQQLGGPDFVKAVKGPMPWTSIMPTGGVKPTRENLEAWFGAGVHCVGIGSQLFKKELVQSGNFELLTERVRETISIIQNLRR